MKIVLVLTVLLGAVYQVNGLAVLLQRADPYCFTVSPVGDKVKINVNYVVTGMNEENVEFTAKQNDRVLAEATKVSKYDVELTPRNTQDIELCWNRLDTKSKKLTFMINQNTANLDQKASADTVESVKAKIESL